MDKKSRAAYMRRYRKTKKLEKLADSHEATIAELPTPPKNPALALDTWAKQTLIVPPGHKDSGKPLVLPEFGIRFIEAALTHRESLMCIGRKNAKSAIIAVYLLARLVGVLAFPGYRAGVCSVNKDKAAELWTQCDDIAKSSGLKGLEFTKVPRKIKGCFGGTVDILSADKSAGHASGFDDAICDELGLFHERDRELVNGLRSSVSARDGRFLALSILGFAPFTKEIISRKDLSTTAVHYYAAPDDCAIDDIEAWRAANPGMDCGIKSMEYMRDEAIRCKASPADERSFRAFDLNQPAAPDRELICSLMDWQACTAKEYPPRAGHCVMGIDIGGSNSMTAAVAIFPENGRVETWCAFGGVPDLAERGQADGVGELYEKMLEAGELRIYPGVRITPVGAFLKQVVSDLDGVYIKMVGADRFRKAEVVDALDGESLFLPMVWRGTGAHSAADGSYDVRAFQRQVRAQEIAHPVSLAWAHAITESQIRYDSGTNPALDKRSQKSRIDVLQAGVIATGLRSLDKGGDNFEIQLKMVG